MAAWRGATSRTSTIVHLLLLARMALPSSQPNSGDSSAPPAAGSGSTRYTDLGSVDCDADAECVVIPRRGIDRVPSPAPRFQAYLRLQSERLEVAVPAALIRPSPEPVCRFRRAGRRRCRCLGRRRNAFLGLPLLVGLRQRCRSLMQKRLLLGLGHKPGRRL